MIPLQKSDNIKANKKEICFSW